MTDLMACGHTAQGTDSTGSPVCAICVGLTPDARKVVEAKPDLAGRMSRCSYSKPGEASHQPGRPGRGWRATPQPQPSSWSLPFFEHRPDEAEDRHYCGCFGWD